MIKYNILRSGQPRPYADTEIVVEVYLDKGLTKEQASDLIRIMNIGFNDNTNKEWFHPKLSYLKETDPGIWEFKMISAYTG